jgi:hypothetical protein
MGSAQEGRDRWFPYYAGFSSDFAGQLIASSSLAKGSALMDPWNGSGTTTFSAALNGHRAVGFDLNPVMAVVAKARLLPQSEITSIAPLLTDILKKAARAESGINLNDPLLIWFAPGSAKVVRRIERAIYRLLVSAEENSDAVDSTRGLSSLAAFFYVALFRVVRSLLHRFKGSNPTWITRPPTASSRIRPATLSVREGFIGHVTQMVSNSSSPAESEFCVVGPTIGVASSERLPVRRGTIDFVLSSPPYCTRIDYGIATSPELAVLGFSVDTRLGELRTRLIGTPTVHKDTPSPGESWGGACLKVLERISSHPSKAAKAYYYKTYIQYFAAMAKSFCEVSRCLRPHGRCVLVVQDSFFKDVHVDLAAIFAEMAPSASLNLRRQVNFPITRTFGSINSRSRSYRNASSATESVLCFVKDV